jgi:hypothetical protein
MESVAIATERTNSRPSTGLIERENCLFGNRHISHFVKLLQ